MAPLAVISTAVGTSLTESCASASDAWRFAPGLPLRRSVISGGMPPEPTMSPLFAAQSSAGTPDISEARPQRTAAACSLAISCSFPAMSVAMIGFAQRASAIECLLARSVDCHSDQSAYSCASTEPSLRRATKRVMPPAIAIDMRLSAPASAFMSRSASAARWRTAGTSEPRRPTSSCVTCTRSVDDLSAICASALAAMSWLPDVPSRSCRASCGIAPAPAIAPRFSGSSVRLRSTLVACSCASTELLPLSTATSSRDTALWVTLLPTTSSMSAPADCSFASGEPPSKRLTRRGMPAASEMATRFSVRDARRQSAPAEVSCAPRLPVLSSPTRRVMPPSCAMSPWLADAYARLHSAPAASPCTSGLPWSSEMISGMPPASAMAA